MSTVSLLLTLLSLPILVSFSLILNIFHILHVKYARIRALYWKKERKVIRLRDCKLKCFSSVILAYLYVNLSFVFIYAQGVLTEFYGIYIYLYINIYLYLAIYLSAYLAIFLYIFIYLSI